jgi:hypothetical protein
MILLTELFSLYILFFTQTDWDVKDFSFSGIHTLPLKMAATKYTPSGISTNKSFDKRK